MMDGALAATVIQLARRRPECAGISVEELHRVREEVADEMQGTYEELRLESFRRALASRGVHDPTLPRWMVDTWMAARVQSVRLHADVEPELDELERRGYRLGAITNGNFPLDRHGLADRMAFIVHAETTGRLKPAPQPFELALQLSGGDSARWVHVGDSIDSDIRGAQAFGLQAVWINRRGLELPEDVTPDAELPSLAGLTAVVDRLLAAA
jgi:putative hydrolase of the HAD superfamily